MNIKVLGSGCMKCQRLYAEAEKAVSATGVDAELVKVQELDDIMSYGVMMTPALVIDDEVKSSGRIPNAKEIATWLKQAPQQ